MADNEQGKHEEQRVHIEGVEFDLSNISVLEWAEFTSLETQLIPYLDKARAQAQFLTKMIVALPEGWGDPADPDTYLRLNMFAQWSPLLTMLWESVADERKKAMTRYMTPLSSTGK